MKIFNHILQKVTLIDVRCGVLKIPRSIKEVHYNAIVGLWNLRKIVVPNGVLKLDAMAIMLCRNLTDIEFEDGCSLESIGPKCFVECDALESVTIPLTVKYIGQYAFYNCSGLENVTLPDRSVVDEKLFALCPKIRNRPEWEDLYDESIDRIFERPIDSLFKK